MQIEVLARGATMNGWIFQGNPKKFKIDEYLLRQEEILWLVRPESFAGKIEVGDAAFIWRSDGLQKGTGGIVARGQIVHEPEFRQDDVPDLWIESVANQTAMRVRIRIGEKRLSPQDGMLLRTDIKEHPVLKNLWIIKRPSQTTFPIKADHLHILLDLWKEEGEKRSC
jgi:hypothetical protein